MSDVSYTFEVKPVRREAAFLYSVFVAYPRIVGRCVFCRRHTVETIIYILLWMLFSPLFILRNMFYGVICTFPFLPDVQYRLTLHEAHLSFGIDDERLLMANAYRNVIAMFKTRQCWTALMRDGGIVYLPPGNEGDAVANAMRSRQTLPDPRWSTQP